MKILKKSISLKRKVTLVIAAVCLVCIGIFAYAYHSKGTLTWWQTPQHDRDPSINLDKPSPGQIQAGDDIKQQHHNNTQNSSPTTSLPAKSTVEMLITNVNQLDGMLQIRSNIITVTDRGTCTLILKKDNVETKRTANVQPLSSTTTCKGFDIPIAELSQGVWHIILTFENETINANTAKDVIIE